MHPRFCCFVGTALRKSSIEFIKALLGTFPSKRGIQNKCIEYG